MNCDIYWKMGNISHWRLFVLRFSIFLQYIAICILCDAMPHSHEIFKSHISLLKIYIDPNAWTSHWACQGLYHPTAVFILEIRTPQLQLQRSGETLLYSPTQLLQSWGSGHVTWDVDVQSLRLLCLEPMSCQGHARGWVNSPTVVSLNETRWTSEQILWRLWTGRKNKMITI